MNAQSIEEAAHSRPVRPVVFSLLFSKSERLLGRVFPSSSGSESERGGPEVHIPPLALSDQKSQPSVSLIGEWDLPLQVGRLGLLIVGPRGWMVCSSPRFRSGPVRFPEEAKYRRHLLPGFGEQL